MAHADKIHLSHYRQPVIEKVILEISQYLEAAQGADMNESDSMILTLNFQIMKIQQRVQKLTMTVLIRK